MGRMAATRRRLKPPARGASLMTSSRGRGRIARRTAFLSSAALLIAGLGLVAAPSASATGWRTLAMRAPSTVVAGVPFDVTVTVMNVAGRPAPAYVGTVRFATDDGLVRSLPAAYTFTRADRGTHVFTGLTLVGTGSHRL